MQFLLLCLMCLHKFAISDKELIAAKERQEIELTAQRQTLNEQRTHIDILDSALTNAQANVVKLEEEVSFLVGMVVLQMIICLCYYGTLIIMIEKQSLFHAIWASGFVCVHIYVL